MPPCSAGAVKAQHLHAWVHNEQHRSCHARLLVSRMTAFPCLVAMPAELGFVSLARILRWHLLVLWGLYVPPPAEPFAPRPSLKIACNLSCCSHFWYCQALGDTFLFSLSGSLGSIKSVTETKQNTASVHIFAQPLHVRFPGLSSSKLQLSERIK